MNNCRSRARQILTQCLTAGYLATWQLGCGSPADEAEPEVAPTLDEVSNPVIGGCCGTGVVDPGIDGFRISTTWYEPVQYFDTGGHQLYLVPYTSNMISLYDGSAWTSRAATDRVQSQGTYSANTFYNIFAHWDGSNVGLELVAEPYPHSPILDMQDGVQVKWGDPSRRYVGVARTDSVGHFVDSRRRRLIWNRHNQVARYFEVQHNTTWSFSGTNSWRPISGNPANGLVEVVAGTIGIANYGSTTISISATGMCTSSMNGYYAASGIGIDSTTVNSAQIVELDNGGPSSYAHLRSSYNGYLLPGYHTINWLEVGQSSSTFACIGYAYSPPFGQLGMIGMVTN